MKRNKEARYLKKNFVKRRRERQETGNRENRTIEREEHELVQLEPRARRPSENKRDDVPKHDIRDSSDDTNCILECKENSKNGNQFSKLFDDKKGEGVKLELAVDDRIKEVTRNDLTPSGMGLPRIHGQDENAGRDVVRLAWVTLAIVFVFIICHSIKWIPNFYEIVMVKITQTILSDLT